MAKQKTAFVCNECGSDYSKWQGQCNDCGAWNCLQEIRLGSVTKGGAAKVKGYAGVAAQLVDLSDVDIAKVPRFSTAIGELDRVLGGGLVPGSAILIGGHPGAGKSTLLLQLMCSLAQQMPALYVTGEESLQQVALRAQRLELPTTNLKMLAETDVESIIATADSVKPKLLVVDSIQVMQLTDITSAPGSVSQVRECAAALVRYAKQSNTVLLLVGHVTKDGNIAGPKVLEHMVDCVLYFEGERGHQFRILRAVKNRFGPADEIGVFEMTDAGLAEVPNPSAIFLADREDGVSGASVFAGIEGSRPMLMEIQALTAPTSFGTPRRAVVGWDANRLSMILAVLEARCGLSIGGHDVYLNVAGGLRISEPAADLAVAAALVSSVTRVPVPAEVVVFGEIGLSGEVRPISQSEVRLKEASKLGFRGAVAPENHRRKGTQNVKITKSKLTEVRIRHLDQLLEYLRQEGEKNPPVDLIASQG